MPMAGDNDKNKKGFSGLSDLASEVSGIDEPIKPEPKAEAKPSTPKQPPQPQREAAPSEPERKTTSSPPPIETVSSGKSGGGSGGKWILGIIGVIFVIWLINNGGQSNKKPSYTPPASSQSYSYPQSTPAPTVQTPKNRPNNQQTREAQQLLTDLGYDPGPIDGQYGRRTSEAIKSFQRDIGLTQDGLVSNDLLNSLNNAKAATTSKVAVPQSTITSKEYEIPPTSRTSANVPWISDAAMEQCVKIYNEAKWLGEEIDRTTVNQYSQTSVDLYNSKISRYSEMVDSFNRKCAGKQSESAYRAAQKLNQQH